MYIYIYIYIYVCIYIYIYSKICDLMEMATIIIKK